MPTTLSCVFYGFRVHGPAGITSNLFDTVQLGDEDKALRARLVKIGEMPPEPPAIGTRTDLGDAEYDKRNAARADWTIEFVRRLYSCSLVVTHDSGFDHETPQDQNRCIYLAIASSKIELSTEGYAQERAFNPKVEDDWIPRLRACSALLGLEMRAPSWISVLW